MGFDTYSLFRYIFIGGAALSVLMLIVAAVQFFVFRIPTIIGDLSGSNARKAIEEIRTQNESTGRKTYKSSPVNRERGRVTDKISPSGRLVKTAPDPNTAAMSTDELGKKEKEVPRDKASERRSESTTVLAESGFTRQIDPARPADTTVLSGDGSPCEANTTVLGTGTPFGGTSVISQPMPASPQTAEGDFRIEYEITFIHTDEIIPIVAL